MNSVFLFMLLLVSLSDIRFRKIPDQYILIMGITGIVSIPFFLEISIMSRIIGALCISLPLLLLCVIWPGSFGGGDIKLMAVSGFYLGWKGIVAAFLTGVLFAGVYSLVMICFGKKERRTEFALGPFLCGGIVIAMFWGESVFSWFIN